MSVTIHWRPTTDKGKHFKNGTSTSLANLKRAIGSTIGPADIDKLHAMAIAAEDAFFSEVAEIVERVGEIEIWGEY